MTKVFQRQIGARLPLAVRGEGVYVIDSNGKIKSFKKNKKSFIASKIAEVVLNKLLIDDRNLN